MCEPSWIESAGWFAAGLLIVVLALACAALMLAAAAALLHNMTKDETANSAIEKSQAPPMPAVKPARKYDGRDGNGYQPEAGQDRPVNPPPRKP